MATCKDCFHWNACKRMLELMWGHSVLSGYEGGAVRCEDFISVADVVPRAEVADTQLLEENKKLRELNEKALHGLRGICKECKKFGTCGNRKGSHFYCWVWKYST